MGQRQTNNQLLDPKEREMIYGGKMKKEEQKCKLK